MSVSPAPINRWTEAAWARRYLHERDAIPHRNEGFSVLFELLAARPAPRRVLDLGTGDGHTLALVLGAYPNATAVGIDFSDEMLGRARARFSGDNRIDIYRHDLDTMLPATLGRFDLVVSSFAIHHCLDARKRALYTEVFGALEAGGMFANLEHVASATPALHAAFLAALAKTPDQDDPSNKLARVDVQLRWLTDIGFVDVDCHWKWRELALLAGTRPAA